MTIDTSNIINREQQVFSSIKGIKSEKEQLKKVASEFESMFITKMMDLMDKTVGREEGILGEENQYMKTFKSHVFQELGRDLASNERTSFGFAKQIYTQMEKYVKD